MISNTTNILGINTIFESINYDGFTHDEFRSATSFMDYDAVLIDTSYLAQHYEADSYQNFEGKRMYFYGYFDLIIYLKFLLFFHIIYLNVVDFLLSQLRLY